MDHTNGTFVFIALFAKLSSFLYYSLTVTHVFLLKLKTLIESLTSDQAIPVPYGSLREAHGGFP